MPKYFFIKNKFLLKNYHHKKNHTKMEMRAFQSQVTFSAYSQDFFQKS